MNSYYDDGGAFAFLAFLLLIVPIIALVIYVISSLFLMNIFEKAGVQGKWRAWIPVYNSMIFLKLGDMSPWLILYAAGASILLSWLPVIGQLLGLASFVLMVLAAYRVGLKLNKGAGFVVLYALGILTAGITTLVWLGINAFDKSRWNAQIAPAQWAGNGFFGDRTVWDGVPVQPSAAAAPGAAPGYGAPQGYQQPGGYPQQAPGYQPPTPGYQQPGYQPPAAPQTPPAAPQTPPAAPGAPTPPPSAPAAPPAAPTTPPTTPPPAAPPAPPTPPADPNQPPA
ncbi:large exoprotein [Microbacterium sp. KHB019]|uniref:large exoprotein n=1 Tax=Microbacterium sp. KHB019 TaxID=3129770 RepID=UPI00307A8749